MGGYCGYLALMSGLASGAERVYLHEEGVTLRDLEADLNHDDARLPARQADQLDNPQRTCQPAVYHNFMAALFEQESGDLFDVRQTILGHLQQGGDPSPFDRIQATRLASHCVTFLIAEAEQGSAAGAFIGMQGGRITISRLDDMPGMLDAAHMRPQAQWWLDLRPISQLLSQPGEPVLNPPSAM